MRWVLCTAVLWYTCSAATITTTPRTFKVRERESLELSCNIADIGDASVGFYKADNLLTLDEDRLSDDDRYTISREGSTFTLTISGVEPIDSGDWACAIVDPEQKVVFKVVVNTAPHVMIHPEANPYNVNVGDTAVVVRCTARGNPAPAVSWERKDNKLPSGVSVRGTQLVISKVERKHAGHYICKATNEAGSDSKTIDINVNDGTEAEAKPWVKTAHTFVPVKKGEDASIICTYDGFPAPGLDWFFNGYKINFSEERFRNAAQMATREKNHTRATLLLTKITEDTFGDYMCRASNALGSEQTVVHVSGRPGPPVIDLDEAQLSWVVRSSEPVIEYRVYLRLEKQDEWTRHESFRVGKNDKTNLDEWSHEISLKPYIEAGVKYQVQVKARNGLGWGSFAKDYLTIEIPAEQQERASSSFLSLLPAVIAVFLARLL